MEMGKPFRRRKLLVLLGFEVLLVFLIIVLIYFLLSIL
jgi:hypothetical protein